MAQNKDVKVLADKMMRAVGDNMRDGEGLVFTYLAVQEAFEPFARAYVALAERVGVLEEALETVMLNNRTGAVGQIAREGWAKARAALTPKASGDEQEKG
jgi:type II secretory pathway component PulF